MKPTNTIRWTEASNPITANIDLINSIRLNSLKNAIYVENFDFCD